MPKFTRKPNRLPFPKLYTNNWYFITICTANRFCIFGKGEDLTVMGEITRNQWLDLPNIFENIILDEFVVMPNHFHGIIGFYDQPISSFSNKPTTLSDIIAKFKSLSWYNLKKSFVEEPLRFQEQWRILMNNEFTDFKGWNGKHSATNFPTIWQKSFYDHVIRNNEDLQRIREYIQNNPLQWDLDELNPKNYK